MMTIKQQIEQMKAAFARHFGVTVQDLTSKCRAEHFVLPRHLAILAGREVLGISALTLAKEFNKANHRSIHHALIMARNRIETNPRIKAAYDEIVKGLTL